MPSAEGENKQIEDGTLEFWGKKGNRFLWRVVPLKPQRTGEQIRFSASSCPLEAKDLCERLVFYAKGIPMPYLQETIENKVISPTAAQKGKKGVGRIPPKEG